MISTTVLIHFLPYSIPMDLLTWNLKLCFLILFHSVLTSGLGNETDIHALLAFKQGITKDPYHVMNSWNGSTHFCNWMGVTCGHRHAQRVVRLNLSNHELVGTISPYVGNLSFLRELYLTENNIIGKIPHEISRLSRLQRLDLSSNSLGGEIPFSLSNCSVLQSLNLRSNTLIGSIPFQLNSLHKLMDLDLAANTLTGNIPQIGNLSSLWSISLAANTLLGDIPNEFGQLSQLQFFEVAENMLSGVIPPSLYNITSITFFSVAVNQIHGSIPPNVGQTLPNLQTFLVDINNFQGPIPNSLGNASKLVTLDFSYNGFSGSVPNNFGNLGSLTVLSLASNKLGHGRAGDLNFITSLSNCTVFESLGLDGNRLGGVLPESIGNLSTRTNFITIGRNLIQGTLPKSIENLVSLTTLGLEINSFSGSIPFGIGKLRKLCGLFLGENKFSGTIPSSFGNLTLLIYIYMEHNMLEGSIPPNLENCKGLLELNISSNKLSGTIPNQILTLFSLIFVDLANNYLSGSLPLDVGTLINLGTLDISRNNLSGEIPSTVGSCLVLEKLRMGGNLLQGPIPQSLENLRGIQIIDLSHNNLTGKIPEFLTNLSFLMQLGLSYNDFAGEVPKEGIFLNASSISVHGNKKLCGGIEELHLPICSDQEVKRSRHFLSPRVIIVITFGDLSYILVLICCLAYWRKTFGKENFASAARITSALEKWKHGVSYLELFNSTHGFSSECLIGSGSFGSVYKGVLNDEKTYVAIKVVNLQQKGASKSFIAECESLKNIKHRNLIKVVTVCSSIDFSGNDFKALIFEFMPNGSLEHWLHPTHTDDQRQSRILSFIQRLNIAIDVAFGLEYLHHSYGEAIVHCDIKPSNILLDTEMTAHVGDFGLARFLTNTANNQPETQTLSSGLKGSIGYIPPEYGISGKVSTLGDMYSYGILLLEMFTGKRPTDEMFRDDLSLYNFVAMALPDNVLDIVDASLLAETQEGETSDPGSVNISEEEEAPAVSRRSMEREIGECLVSLLTIALSCCSPLARDRAVVTDIVKKLIAVKELFCRTP